MLLQHQVEVAQARIVCADVDELIGAAEVGHEMAIFVAPIQRKMSNFPLSRSLEKYNPSWPRIRVIIAIYTVLGLNQGRALHTETATGDTRDFGNSRRVGAKNALTGGW